MKQAAFLFLLFSTGSTSFTLLPSLVPRSVNISSLRSSAEAPSDVESEDVGGQPTTSSLEGSGNTSLISLRNELLSITKSLVEDSPTGIFITLPDAMDEFTSAASRLEAITPSMTEKEKDLLLGDWELVATSRKITSINVPKKSELPFELKSPPKLSDSIRNSITVLQRIRSTSEESDEIDRVDHVIQYKPLTLSDLIPEDSPLSAIRSFNLNPLEVSKGKVILVHNAEIESVEPTLRTKLGLRSVVVNVAGTSQYLEADGEDILGLNIPSLGDFANGGSFDSTYVDENVRVSRGTLGFLEETRLFVREGFDVDSALISEEEVGEEEGQVIEDVKGEEASVETEESVQVEAEASLTDETPEEVTDSVEDEEITLEEEQEDDPVEVDDDLVESTEVLEKEVAEEVESTTNDEALKRKTLEGMTTKKLKEKLKSAGLPTDGRKADLIQRLMDVE
eukprot:CAMPEP_0203673616 /NCGR_PEP_ID=MMETSP0090-20130426/13262_1 /ASSEMBLY_ACC=CAM_ASM_001088 /TAXON_ID=426623 /ORGANISM="Chaetoceros affinis, Strain CCMP159" /LENGTH=451 /DNA_ID=CAMNT_0050539313 /DNA_START=26 /DNA_END=1381 /DNA_ORIENTATION=-